MGNQKGAAINETVQAIKFNEHLRKLSENRDRQVKRRKKKEACTAATEQASSIKNMQLKIHNDDNTTEEICQVGSVSDE